MNSPQITFDSKSILNIAAMKGGEVSLSKGEVVSGTVQQVNDNGLIVINIKGRNIEAFSEVAVQEGQKLYLSVDDVRGGKTYLKVMTPDAMEKMESANLVANLRNMNVVANDASVQLARKLIQYQLPVTEKNLNELTRMVNQLGGRNAQNLEIAAYALSRGVGSDASSLKALQQFISQKTDSLVRFINLVAALPDDADADALNALRSTVLALAEDGAEAAQNAAPRGSSPAPAAGEAAARLAASTGTLGANPAAPGLESARLAATTFLTAAADETLPTSSQPAAAVAADADGAADTLPGARLANAAATATNAPVKDGIPGPLPAGTEKTAAAPGQPGAASETARSTPVQPGTVLTEGEAALLPAAQKGSPSAPASSAAGAPLTDENGELAAGRAESTASRTAVTSETTAGAIARPETTPTGSADRLLLDLFRALSDRATVRMDRDSSLIASDLKDRIMGEKDLLKGLAVLKQLAFDDSAIERQPLARDILRTIDGLEKDLSGQRLFNFTSRTGGDVNPSVYYFSIPVKYDDQFRMMQLRMSGEGGRRSLVDPEHLSIAVSLETENLGIVLYHLDWYKKGDINIQGLVQTQDIADYMGLEMDRLVGNLAEMGYNVNNMGIKVSKTVQEADELKPQLVETTETVKPFGIDVKA